MFPIWCWLHCQNEFGVFSQTWLRYVWLMAWQIRLSCRLDVCRLWRACTPTQRVNFSGIFLHHIVAWHPATHPQKITKIVQGDHHPQRAGSLNVRGWEKVAISDQYLAIARERLKIDGYMLRCVWPVLNPLSIHVTFTAIVPGTYRGRPISAKMC